MTNLAVIGVLDAVEQELQLVVWRGSRHWVVWDFSLRLLEDAVSLVAATLQFQGCKSKMSLGRKRSCPLPESHRQDSCDGRAAASEIRIRSCPETRPTQPSGPSRCRPSWTFVHRQRSDRCCLSFSANLTCASDRLSSSVRVKECHCRFIMHFTM